MNTGKHGYIENRCDSIQKYRLALPWQNAGGRRRGRAAKKKEKSGFPRLSLVVNHWFTIQIEMIPAGYAIPAEAHVLDLDQSHDAHGVITVIHVVGSGLLADFLDGNDSTLHNKSPSRIGWPTSYLCIHYTKNLGKCKMAK